LEVENEFNSLYFFNLNFEKALHSLEKSFDLKYSNIERDQIIQLMASNSYNDLLRYYVKRKPEINCQAFYLLDEFVKPNNLISFRPSEREFKPTIRFYTRSLLLCGKFILSVFLDLVYSLFSSKLHRKKVIAFLDELFLENAYADSVDLKNLDKFLDEFFSKDSRRDTIVLLRCEAFAGVVIDNSLIVSDPLSIILRRFVKSRDLPFFFINLIVYILFLAAKIPFYPYLALIAKDLFLAKILRLLDEKNLVKELILTNSSIYQQPLFMHRNFNSNYKKSMAWYSVNSKWFIFKHHLKSYTYLPLFKRINVERHYVWNEDQLNWLSKEVNLDAEMIVSGPIMFRPRLAKIEKKNRELLNIFVFDVAPFENGSNQERVYGKSFIYYSDEICIKFIQDLVSWAEIWENVRLHVKCKRKYSEYHSLKYRQYLDSLRSNKKVSFIDEGTDLNLIMSCHADLVACIPFTSVSYVAESYGVPSTYYDPSERLLLNYDLGKNQSFLSGKNELVKYLDFFYRRFYESEGVQIN
jgi:polysaccharide biosynthesis PFTS motif protein